MTEVEWTACTDPQAMVHFLGDRTSDRKLRLFALGCCHRFHGLILDERTRAALGVAERMAEGKVDPEEHQAAYEAATEAAEYAHENRLAAEQEHPAGSPELEEAVRAASLAEMGEWVLADGWGAAERAACLDWDQTQHRPRHGFEPALLRCIFGPLRLRSIIIDASWRAATVNSLAQAIYDERAFDRMPILADALEDAGCANADILGHCRGGGQHVRGCWVVDLVLCKG